MVDFRVVLSNFLRGLLAWSGLVGWLVGVWGAAGMDIITLVQVKKSLRNMSRGRRKIPGKEPGVEEKPHDGCVGSAAWHHDSRFKPVSVPTGWIRMLIKRT